MGNKAHQLFLRFRPDPNDPDSLDGLGRRDDEIWQQSTDYVKRVALEEVEILLDQAREVRGGFGYGGEYTAVIEDGKLVVYAMASGLYHFKVIFEKFEPDQELALKEVMES
jgi:hypothetical protein